MAGWRPGPLRNASDQKLRDEADEGFKHIYTLHYGLADSAVIGAGNTGYKQQLGSTTVTGSKSVPTQMTTVTNVHAMINSKGAPLNEWVTAQPSKSIQGGIDITVWKPTASGDNTPIASTTPWEIQWVVQGS